MWGRGGGQAGRRATGTALSLKAALVVLPLRMHAERSVDGECSRLHRSDVLCRCQCAAGWRHRRVVHQQAAASVWPPLLLRNLSSSNEIQQSSQGARSVIYLVGQACGGPLGPSRWSHCQPRTAMEAKLQAQVSPPILSAPARDSSRNLRPAAHGYAAATRFGTAILQDRPAAGLRTPPRRRRRRRRHPRSASRAHSPFPHPVYLAGEGPDPGRRRAARGAAPGGEEAGAAGGGSQGGGGGKGRRRGAAQAGETAPGA